MARKRKWKQYSVLPGFGLSMGFTMMYVTLLIFIPLTMIFLNTATMGWGNFWAVVTEPRVVASYKLSIGAAFAAASINAVFGLLIAWVLVRYNFPGKRFIDGLIDLPFALPTAVAGIALTSLYATTGWVGQYLDIFGIRVAFTPLGVIVALTFIGLPFVVRMVQPVLEGIEKEVEEASASLGATRFHTFFKVILPVIFPALLSGFALAFARALGEYGSVVFISGNMPMRTEITPLLIMTKLEQFDYIGATAIAAVMLVFSFIMLLVINAIQWWSQRRYA
ncbi:sulfate/thiosulfate transporter subunit [Alkalihalobacillus alcalophilus ATCC 27647 = CGMCC 1.3604]|uniref:Sulfate transport system permease protein CysT n=2 Tax=Alkalihalobacillus alcalophilus ATCC 27647 = CGMCC 1.3604 TaxID=1218173 RepID=A0A094WLS3_ALKAL|nr:sulfate ABC transporter permease subunit CysT [Alkalihalobacillus alcalophilus]KGA98699.1 sulfate ABC transporter permease [Alkalihalobacillus alcalophilus ATCC 27647 = CGMCC 1.3604]MED1560325.1 sulfate ABC transporter permease subunit CysT [Alkalihalobacillus alcalophilus]THG89770.1 sulfate/thiosulfate transporter subunit [Alkalihalobacillus alcalophilus ATCC 27647 = CGMCC 1.3604]